MSFPKYDRSLTNMSFADLARYTNNNQDGDISLFQCVDDLNGFGEIGPSNVGLRFQVGYDKVDNVSGSSNNRKGRVDVFAGLNCLNGDEYLSSKGFVRPTTDPFGASLDWTDESSGSDHERFYRPSYARFNSARAWLWAEEDTVEYPSGAVNTKQDRLILGDNPSGFNEIGQSLGMLPFVHPLSTDPLVFVSSGLDSTHISQTNVYGVPEGFTFANVSVDHRYNGSGQYWLWFATAYRASSINTSSTNSYGFNGTYIDGNGQWLGPYFRSNTTAETSNGGNTFQSGLRGLANKLIGLEDNFIPEDTTVGSYNSGLNNNFADFGIEMIVEISVFI